MEGISASLSVVLVQKKASLIVHSARGNIMNRDFSLELLVESGLSIVIFLLLVVLLA
jgi:hypothetical protein